MFLLRTDTARLNGSRRILPLNWHTLATLTDRSELEHLRNMMLNHCNWAKLADTPSIWRNMQHPRDGTSLYGRARTAEDVIDWLRARGHGYSTSVLLDRTRVSTLREELVEISQHFETLQTHLHKRKQESYAILDLDNLLQLSTAISNALPAIDSILPTTFSQPARQFVFPLDITSIIKKHLADVRFLSHASRTLLFRSLELRNDEDVRFLRTILCTKLSGWIHSIIRDLAVHSTVSALADLPSLLGCLSALESLHFIGGSIRDSGRGLFRLYVTSSTMLRFTNVPNPNSQ